MQDFLYYPELEDPNFYEDIYKKKEFRRSKIDPEQYYAKTMEELCGTGTGTTLPEKILQPHQEFLRNFISTETPYNGILLFHGVGTGKTCAAISIAEAMKPRLKDLGKKVYIIAPSQTTPNFESEIYNVDLDRKENRDGVEPGTYQCTGQTYYVPRNEALREKGMTKEQIQLGEEKRDRLIKSRSYGRASIYEFFGQGTSFPSYVEFNLTKPENVFSNSLIIIDEAHNLVTETTADLEEGEEGEGKKKKKITKKTTQAEEHERGPGPVKNTLETLKDIFSGYHAFKTQWLQGNSKLKRDITQLRSKLEETKKPRATIRKLLERDVEMKASQAWAMLPESEKKTWLKKAPKNTKLILMTATPMENSPKELVELLNLLRLNDKRPLIDNSKLFHDLDNSDKEPSQQVNKTYLCQVAKGYISYVRGQNPITFPAVFDPPEDLLYNPGYLNPSDPNDTVPIPLYSIDGKSQLSGIALPLRLVYSPMSTLQYITHKNYVQKVLSSQEYAIETGKKVSRGALQLGLNGRQLSNIVFPTLDPTIATYGNPAFDDVFKKIIIPKQPIGRTKTGNPLSPPPALQFAFNEKLGINGFRAFIKQEPLIDKPEFGLLDVYSKKYSQVIENMQDPEKWGINFCYSDFVACGALSLGIVLELNGYVKYSHRADFRTNAKGIYLKNTYDPLIKDDIYDKLKISPRYRCYKCARILEDPIHNKKNNDPLYHPFKQGTFILFVGTGSETLRARENEIVKQRDNKDGVIIKVILGSKVSGEGVNFMNVRQVHILDPWHHFTRIYQAMGRAIRHCSHRDLPPDQRNVTVYKYSATVPDLLKDQQMVLKKLYNNRENLSQLARPDVSGITLRDLMTETTDEMVYFRVLRKDILIKYIERILKEVAIDCAFFKAINVFPQDKFPSEIDGSRLCDYLPCNYPCIWGCDPTTYWDPTQEYDINTDTYKLFFSKVQVDRVVRYLQKIFQQNWALKLDDIIKQIKKKDPGIEIDYIYQALDRMLQETPDRPVIIDRFKREGYLIFRGDYYVYQPKELSREDTPIYYRSTVTKVTPIARNIERLKPTEIVIKKKDTIDTTRLNTLLEKLLADPDIIRTESELDTLSRPELQYFYENLIINNGTTNLAKIVNNYLGKRRLLLETDAGYLGHFINKARMYVPGKKGDVGTFVDTPELKIVDANNFLIDMERKEKPLVLFDPDDPFDLQYRFYGYYDDEDKSFKLVDLSTEVTKLTKEGDFSIKSYVKGRRCDNFQKVQLINIATTLSEVPDLLTESEREILRNPIGIKPDFCERIQKALRILNERDKTRRWFLYPGEQRCVEFDSNGRHLLIRNPATRNPRSCIKTVEEKPGSKPRKSIKKAKTTT